MLTITASSRSPRSNAGRIGFGRPESNGGVTGAPSCPVRHERLLGELRVVLAQRMASEAFVEQDRTQVSVAAKHDPVHVVALALRESGRPVKRHERVDDRIALGNGGLHPN